MGLSNIQWTDYTYNPWRGCRKVAPECANCYIVTTMAWNRAAALVPVRPRVFCLSLGDWLDDENVPAEWLRDLLAMIYATPHLDWLLLTKRPQNWKQRILSAASSIGHADPMDFGDRLAAWVSGERIPANVWIGVSAGADQAAALDIPARVHFLSCEPMLRPLDTTHAARFDWIIFGGESGKKARALWVDWIRDGLRFCRENKIAPFVKQLGAAPVWNRDESFRYLKDSHGGDMAEWPADLRVREFPRA